MARPCHALPYPALLLTQPAEQIVWSGAPHLPSAVFNQKLLLPLLLLLLLLLLLPLPGERSGPPFVRMSWGAHFAVRG